MEKKNQLTIFGIMLILIIVNFLGCTEQTSTEKLVTAPLNTLVFTVDEIPTGFSEAFNSSNPTIGFSIESYTIVFYRNHSLNQTEMISIQLNKFNSTEFSKKGYNGSIELITGPFTENWKLINDSIGKIGDESAAFSISSVNHNENNVTIISYKILFRISNVVCQTSFEIVDYNYSSAFELTKIIEQKI